MKTREFTIPRTVREHYVASPDDGLHYAYVTRPLVGATDVRAAYPAEFGQIFRGVLQKPSPLALAAYVRARVSEMNSLFTP